MGSRRGGGIRSHGKQHRMGAVCGRAGGGSRQAVRRSGDQHRVGGGASVARPPELLGSQVGGADRHQGQGDRGADGRDVHQDPPGTPRRHRRLRCAERHSELDAGPGQGRSARGAGPLRRQVRLPRGTRQHRTHLPRQPDEGRRQDLRIPGRRRPLRPVLPQGPVRGSREPGRVQGEARLRPRAAADLGAVRPDWPVHHRQVRAGDLRRRAVPRARLRHLAVRGTLPGGRRALL